MPTKSKNSYGIQVWWPANRQSRRVWCPQVWNADSTAEWISLCYFKALKATDATDKEAQRYLFRLAPSVTSLEELYPTRPMHLFDCSPIEVRKNLIPVEGEIRTGFGTSLASYILKPRAAMSINRPQGNRAIATGISLKPKRSHCTTDRRRDGKMEVHRLLEASSWVKKKGLIHSTGKKAHNCG